MVLRRLQGFVEYLEHRSMATAIVHRGDAAKPTPWTDASGNLVADALRFIRVANEIVGGAVKRTHGAPLGSGLIVPVDVLAVRSARQRTLCPACRVGDECSSVDQDLFLHGRGQGVPPFVAVDQQPQRFNDHAGTSNPAALILGHIAGPRSGES